MEEGEVLILSNGKRAALGAGTARFFRTLLMRVQIVKSVTGKDLASFLLRYFFTFLAVQDSSIGDLVTHSLTQ